MKTQIDRRIQYFLIFSIPIIILISLLIVERKSEVPVSGTVYPTIADKNRSVTKSSAMPIARCLAPQKSLDKKTVELFLNDGTGFSDDRTVQIYVLSTGSFTLLTLAEFPGDATNIPLSVADAALFKEGEELRFVAVQGESLDLSIHMDEARGCPVFIN
ncbi:MAG: hypothetical protein WC489_04665 [Patescibacteria group bacterium]